MSTQVYTLKLTDECDDVIDEFDVSLYGDGSKGEVPTRERILASIYKDIADGQDMARLEKRCRA